MSTLEITEWLLWRKFKPLNAPAILFVGILLWICTGIIMNAQNAHKMVLTQDVIVNIGGEAVSLKSGQEIDVLQLGTDSAIINVKLSGGSVGVTQINASFLRNPPGMETAAILPSPTVTASPQPRVTPVAPPTQAPRSQFQIKADALKKAINDSEQPTTGPYSPSRFGSNDLASVKKTLILALDYNLRQLDNTELPNDFTIASLKNSLNDYPVLAVKQALEDLISEISDERVEKDKVLEANFNAIKENISSLLLSSKKVEELDKMSSDIKKYEATYESSNQINPHGQVIYNYSDLVRTWQNYLYHKAQEDWPLAAQDLEEIDRYNHDVVPRSEILNREKEASDHISSTRTIPSGAPGAFNANEFVAQVSRVEDLDSAIAKLDEMRTGQSPNFDMQSTSQYLKNVRQLYQDLKSGLNPVDPNLEIFDPHLFRSGLQYEVSLRLHKQVQMAFLHAYFSSYKGSPTSDDETVPQFIDQVVDDADARSDVYTLKQALLTKKEYLKTTLVNPQSSNPQRPSYPYSHQIGLAFPQTPYSPQPIPTPDPDSLNMLFAALNQETAQQYEDAVYSFESALKSASPVIPLQLIGNHLNRIQKDHPKEFTDGVALYRSHN